MLFTVQADRLWPWIWEQDCGELLQDIFNNTIKHKEQVVLNPGTPICG